MSYPSFTYEQSLPSVKVTKDFVLSLEQYLIKRATDLSALSAEDAQKSVRIKIEDRLGAERLTSITQLEVSRFADSTNRIEVELESPYKQDGTKIRIRLSFARGRLLSTVAIAATMPNAREVVLGLKDGLMRIIEPQKIWHWLVHPNAQVWGVAFAIGAWLMYSLSQLTGKENNFSYLLGALALLWLYLFAMSSLRPYTVFDSRASERSDKIWTWFIGALASFLLFGTLFTYFRRSFLGF